jgi:hypothetical protein
LDVFKKISTWGLILGVIALLWQVKTAKDEAWKLTCDNFKLNQDLQQQIVIANGKVKVLYRDKEVIKYKIRYIPIEAPNTTITTDTSGKVNISGDWYGLTFFPWLGISTPLSPTLGARIAYFDRYGISIMANEQLIGVGIDSRINYGFIQNSAFGLRLFPPGIYYSVFF